MLKIFNNWWHEKLDHIYNEIKNDFSFLSSYGFAYSYNEHHYVMPSVICTDGVRRLQIGMNYEEQRMFVVLYEKEGQLCGEDLLYHKELSGKRYHQQVKQVIDYITPILKC